MRLRLIILFILSLLLSGCSTDDPSRQNTFIPLTSIEVTGTYDSMAPQTTNQYRAIGDFSGVFTRDISTEVSWGIENENIATVDTETGSEGLVTALTPGETTITAWYGDISGSAPVTVSDIVLSAIEITPQDAELAVGATRQYEAIGVYSDSSTQDITSLVTWQSSNPGIASIDSAGLLTAKVTGNVMITGSWQGIDASVNLTVNDMIEDSITITPDQARIAQGTTVQFEADATFSDGQAKVITWGSSKNSVAIVDNTGLAEGIGPGQAEISASYDANGVIISATAQVTVTGTDLLSILVTPENSIIQYDATDPPSLQYTATGTFSDNSQQDITRDVTWLSTDETVGIMSNSSFSRGLFISKGPGTTFIEAFFQGVGDQTLLTVEQ
jgi:uncharacterized protein YjdB